MRIDHIETIHLYFEYPEGKGWVGPWGRVKGRLASLIRVHTDDGRVGTGSAYSHPELVEVTVKHLRPFLIGLDPLQIERMWWRLFFRTNWYGRKGVALTTMGGLDQAFWDLLGQQEGKPVWELLGGEDSRVPAYASGLLYSSPATVADTAVRMVEKGFRRVKFRTGVDEQYDRETVSLTRAAVGPKIDLMADGTRRYNLEMATSLARHLVEHRIFWFEEPFQPLEIDDLVALRQVAGLPIAVGECEFGVEGFRELIRCGAADILQADASRCGGISELNRIAEMTKSAGLQFAPHSWCDPVAVIANGHVVAAHRHGLTVEVDQTGNHFIEGLLGEPLTVEDGLLDLGRRPGLGIELDPDFVEEHRLPDVTQIPDGNHGDMIFGFRATDPIPPYTTLDGRPLDFD